MERHFLVTVGDDLNSLYGVHFVRSFFENREQLKLTLFYVAPRFDCMDGCEDVEQRNMERRLARLYRSKGQAALDACRDLLLNRGFMEDRVSMKLMTKHFGTVKDIIHEAREGLYDAVALGRRGYVVFERTLSTSVSREIMHHEIDFPIWICRRPEEDRRNVLLCVDETEPSLRIADHVGFVLEPEKQHHVMLFHVDTGHKRDVDAMMEQARLQLVQNGIEAERIGSMVVRKRQVVNAVLEEAEKGSYAVVAVGRGGKPQRGVLQKWMVGSTSMKLLETLDRAVLWVSK